MHLQESGEMYLETILVLSKEKSVVRAIDVGEYMHFSKPSVSRAVGLLKNGGFLTVEADGHIRLTDTGREIAEKIYTRHTVLTDVLTALDVPPEIAAADACKIEHDISDETFAALCRHMEKYKKGEA